MYRGLSEKRARFLKVKIGSTPPPLTVIALILENWGAVLRMGFIRATTAGTADSHSSVARTNSCCMSLFSFPTAVKPDPVSVIRGCLTVDGAALSSASGNWYADPQVSGERRHARSAAGLSPETRQRVRAFLFHPAKGVAQRWLGPGGRNCLPDECFPPGSYTEAALR